MPHVHFVPSTGEQSVRERTLVLVKPDAVERGLIGEVLRRIEAKGYRVVALDLRTAGRDLREQHYAEHVGKPFYEPLVEFMSSGPVVAAVGSVAPASDRKPSMQRWPSSTIATTGPDSMKSTSGW